MKLPAALQVKRVPVPPGDRYANAEPPAQLHDWTLEDAGPFKVPGKDALQVRARCKCGSRRYFERAAWYGRRLQSRCCRACYFKSSTHKSSRPQTCGRSAYTPLKAPILPYRE